MPDSNGSTLPLHDIEPRKGSPSPRMDRAEFIRRFLSQFIDPAFGALSGDLQRVADAAWDAYYNSRKSPMTRKAGPGFADPNYDLAVDWLVAQEAVWQAEERHRDPTSHFGCC